MKVKLFLFQHRHLSIPKCDQIRISRTLNCGLKVSSAIIYILVRRSRWIDFGAALLSISVSIHREISQGFAEAAFFGHLWHSQFKHYTHIKFTFTFTIIRINKLFAYCSIHFCCIRMRRMIYYCGVIVISSWLQVALEHFTVLIWSRWLK